MSNLYQPTPEGAINSYLWSVTSRFGILSLVGPESNSQFTRYSVVADCKFNRRGSDQGRADGRNVYFFDLDHTSFGWHVVAANGGP